VVVVVVVVVVIYLLAATLCCFYWLVQEVVDADQWQEYLSAQALMSTYV
jgi:hypothetical protein